MKQTIDTIQPGTRFTVPEIGRVDVWTRGEYVATIPDRGDGYWITMQVDGEDASMWVPKDTIVEPITTE